jgi:hypothetical protein
MMALLYGATSSTTIKELMSSIEYQNMTQFRSKIVLPAHKAGLIDFDSATGEITISPLGQRYVEENVPLTL